MADEPVTEHEHPDTGTPSTGIELPADGVERTVTLGPAVLNVDEVAALLLPYISHVHDGWARQEAIKAAREVAALTRPENEVRADALDELAKHLWEQGWAETDVLAFIEERIQNLRAGGA